MISVSQTVSKLIEELPLVEEGLAKGIINLSAFARVLKPRIEEELMKPIRQGSIVMALRRVAQRSKDINRLFENTLRNIQDITVKSNLTEYTYVNSDTLSEKYINLTKQIKLYPEAFFTATKGVRETTLIIGTDLKEEIEKLFQKEKLVSKIESLSSITLRHSKEVVYMHGFHYTILKPLAWNGVNVMESVSAYTEFTVVLESKDVDRAFKILKQHIDS